MSAALAGGPAAAWRRWAPPVLWAATLLVATSWPNPNVPEVPQGDTAVHLTLYGVLAFLVGRAAPSVLRTVPRALAAVTAVSLLAWLDEWHQAFIPGRAQSTGDWLADTVGAVAGFALAAFLLVRRQPAAS